MSSDRSLESAVIGRWVWDDRIDMFKVSTDRSWRDKRQKIIWLMWKVILPMTTKLEVLCTNPACRPDMLNGLFIKKGPSLQIWHDLDRTPYSLIKTQADRWIGIPADPHNRQHRRLPVAYW